MNIKKHIPNAITCCNLLCGCLAIVNTFEWNLVMAAFLVGLAAIFDFFDGFAARMLKVSSPIGKDLDSLADMVTFGVVPGVMMFQLMILNSLAINHPDITYYVITKGNLDFNLTDKLSQLDPIMNFIPYCAFIITIFSAIRLAKFNNDTRQTDSFIGVPTPAVAIFICSLPLILRFNSLNISLHPYLLVVLSIVFSILLVSELPLFALKFKHFKWKGNEIRFSFLLISVLLLVILQFVGIPLVIILYILMSLVSNTFFKPKSSV